MYLVDPDSNRRYFAGKSVHDMSISIADKTINESLYWEMSKEELSYLLDWCKKNQNKLYKDDNGYQFRGLNIVISQ